MTLTRSVVRSFARDAVRGLTELAGGGAASFDIYVDSASGNDSNAGTSSGAALQSLSAMETAALAFGSNVRIGFADGSSWRGETFDLASLSGVVLNKTGSGAMPIFDGSADFGASWDDSTDRADSNTNTYSQVQNYAANGYPMVFEDDAPLKFVNTVALVDAEAGTFTVSGGTGAQTPGNQTYYIHPTSSTDPNSDGKTYVHFQTAAPGVGDDATLTGLHFRRFGSRNGVTGGTGALINACLFEDGTTHLALFESGEYRNCVEWTTIDDSREGHIGLEFFISSGTGEDIKWDSCIVVGVDGATQTQTGIGGHTGGALYDSVECVDCSLQHAAIALTGLCATTVLTRPYVKDGSKTSITVNGATANTITDPWIEYSGAQKAINCGDQATTITGLRYYGDANTAAVGDFAGGLTLTRSVIVGAGNSRRRGPWDSAGALRMEGVLFDSVSGNFNPSVQCASVNAANDDNCYYPNLDVDVGASTYTTIAALRSGESTDANSIDTDPQITDAANGDFTPAGTVPSNSGLERDVTCQNYTPIPASVSAAKTWILAQL